MFIWQASVAISNLMDPPVVDSTERLNIGDIDMIVITICPLKQWKEDKLRYWRYRIDFNLFQGYEHIFDIVNGYQKKFVGWGAKRNLTFDELVPNLIKYRLKKDLIDSRLSRNGKSIEFNHEIKLYPMHGYCYDIVNFTAGGELRIRVPSGGYEEAQVYITDKRMRTRNTVFAESQFGSRIILKNSSIQEFAVKVEELSNFDPRNPDDCKEYEHDAYDECIDDELQKVWKPMINCNPPWISAKDQCNDIINMTQKTADSVRKMTFNTVNGIYEMKTYPAKESCKKPCTVTQPNIFYGKEHKGESSEFTLILSFADQVVYTTKKLAYGSSNFLIDMGSSLGLWFGLSVFGITDLGITAFQWIKNSRQEVIRKFMN
jgi:hypothetical protein